MTTLELLAQTALRRDNLQLRSLTQDFLREYPSLRAVARPHTDNMQVLGTAAALVELLAQRTNQMPPLWTQEVGAVPEPTFLLQAASQMPRLRELCEAEAPEPLRKRHLYAPPDFLSFA
jgi:hypothetical protein